jgi:hypothetical protein
MPALISLPRRPAPPPVRRVLMSALLPGLLSGLLWGVMPGPAAAALADGDEPPPTSNRLFEATVIEALAVAATPPLRCWIEADPPAREPPPARDPPRCTDNGRTRESPDHWIVDYQFRGNQYRVQLDSHPGSTIMVDRDGVPRG